MKRKSHLLDHIKKNHGSEALINHEIDVQCIANKQYIDPYPYTLQMLVENGLLIRKSSVVTSSP